MKPKPLNQTQKLIIKRVKDGAFKDAIGFIEIIKKPKLTFWFHCLQKRDHLGEYCSDTRLMQDIIECYNEREKK